MTAQAIVAAQTQMHRASKRFLTTEATEMLLHDQNLTHRIIGAAIKIHRKLGPGLLESAYESCFAFELDRFKLSYKRQCEIPIDYDGHLISCAYRADFIIE